MCPEIKGLVSDFNRLLSHFTARERRSSLIACSHFTKLFYIHHKFFTPYVTLKMKVRGRLNALSVMRSDTCSSSCLHIFCLWSDHIWSLSLADHVKTDVKPQPVQWWPALNKLIKTLIYTNSHRMMSQCEIKHTWPSWCFYNLCFHFLDDVKCCHHPLLLHEKQL